MAQERLKLNRKTSDKGATNEYLLSGRLRCATCGDKNWSYYICKGMSTAYSIDGVTCTCKGAVDVQPIDNSVWRAIESLITHPETIIKAINHRNAQLATETLPDQVKLKRDKEQLRELDNELLNLVGLYIKKDPFPESILDAKRKLLDMRRKVLIEEIAVLERKLSNVETTPLDPEFIEIFCSEITPILDKLTFAEKRQVLDRLGIVVTLEGEPNGRILVSLSGQIIRAVTTPKTEHSVTLSARECNPFIRVIKFGHFIVQILARSCHVALCKATAT